MNVRGLSLYELLGTRKKKVVQAVDAAGCADLPV